MMLLKNRCIRIEDLLDIKNRDLYEFVRQSLSLSVAETTEPYYGLFTKGNSAIIYVPKGKTSPSSFAHELLHAELKIKGILFSTKPSVSERPLLIPIFSENLSDHITNVMEHRKMFPKFVAMGYKEEEFLADALEPIIKVPEANAIAEHIKDRQGKYSPQGIDLFIGKYLAAIGTCFTFFNYDKELQILRECEPVLTSIIDGLITRWDKYDIEKEGDPLEDSCLLIPFDFLDEIEEWVKEINIY